MLKFHAKRDLSAVPFHFCSNICTTINNKLLYNLSEQFKKLISKWKKKKNQDSRKFHWITYKKIYIFEGGKKVISFIKYAVNRKKKLSVVDSPLLWTFVHQGWLHLDNDKVISVARPAHVEVGDVFAI